MRNLKWLADVDCNEVFPRGYDLSLETDTQVPYCDTRVLCCQQWTNKKRVNSIVTIGVLAK